jgi:DNA-binding GntR family transcriptional regulator
MFGNRLTLFDVLIDPVTRLDRQVKRITQEAAHGLGTIRRPPLRDLLFDSIKSAALRGDLMPGQLITEVDLAKRLGVAQATVREALIELAAHGFVQRRKRRTYVAALSRADIEATYAVRIPLEKLAVEWLALKGDRDLGGLERAHLRMTESARRSDLAEFKEADLAFHAELWAAAGNPCLQEVLERLVPRLFAFSILTIRHYHPGRQKLEKLTEFHEEILRAVRARDVEAATEALVASMDLTWLDERPLS